MPHVHQIDARHAWYPSTDAPDTGYFRYGVGFRLYRTQRLGPTRRRATLYACLFVLPVCPIARYDYEEPTPGNRAFVSTGPAVHSDWVLSAWTFPILLVVGVIASSVIAVRTLAMRLS